MLLDFIICKLLLHFRNNASYVWLFSCFSQTIATINRQHQDLEKCKKLLNFGSNCVKNLKITLKKYFKICWQHCIHSKISSFIKITPEGLESTGIQLKSSPWFHFFLCYVTAYMRKYLTHVVSAQGTT